MRAHRAVRLEAARVEIGRFHAVRAQGRAPREVRDGQRHGLAAQLGRQVGVRAQREVLRVVPQLTVEVLRRRDRLVQVLRVERPRRQHHGRGPASARRKQRGCQHEEQDARGAHAPSMHQLRRELLTPAAVSGVCPDRSSARPTQSPRLPTRSPRLPTRSPRLPTRSPRLPTRSHASPHRSPRLPTRSPRLPTRSPRFPTRSPRLPTRSPRLPTRSPRFPTRSPRFPTRSPRPPARSRRLPPRSPPPPLALPVRPNASRRRGTLHRPTLLPWLPCGEPALPSSPASSRSSR